MARTRAIKIAGILTVGAGITSITGIGVGQAASPVVQPDPSEPQPIVSATADFAPSGTPATTAELAALPGSDPTGQNEATSLAEVAGWRDSLLAKFPDTFGGMYNRGDNSYVVLSVGDGAEITRWVQQQATRLTVGQLLVPSVSVAQSPVSLATLKSYADKVAAAIPVAVDGIHLGGAGVDEKGGRVVVYTVGDQAADVATRLAARFGGSASLYEVIPLAHPGPLDRTTDSPPWNAGDAIWDASGSGAFCSTGFGVHNGAGHYLLTAGHCGNRNWKNADPSRIVGASLPSSIHAPSFGHSGWDMQLLAANGGSSDIFWKGASTREYVAAAASPTQGDPICGEGAFGLESCGVISDPDASICLSIDPFNGTCDEVLLNAFIVPGEVPTHGDSGGPMVQVSHAPYSYVAKGTIDDDVTVQSGIAGTAGEAINAELYLEGVSINTPGNP